MATAASQLRDWKSKVDMKDPASTALATGEFVAPCIDSTMAAELNVLHLLNASALDTLTGCDNVSPDNVNFGADMGQEGSLLTIPLSGNDLPLSSVTSSCSSSALEVQQEDALAQDLSDSGSDDSASLLKDTHDLQSLIKYVQLHAFDSQLKRLRTVQANDGAMFPTTNTLAEGISKLIRLGVLQGAHMPSKATDSDTPLRAGIPEVDLATSLETEREKCTKLEEELRIERRVKEGLMQELCRFFTSRHGMEFVEASRQGLNNSHSHSSDEEIITLLRMQQSPHLNTSKSPQSSQCTSPVSSGRSSLDSPYRSASNESILSRSSLSCDKKSADTSIDQTIAHSPNDIRLYQMLVDQGYSEAQYKLGYLHEHGLGVIQDGQHALALYRKAATQGHVKAQFVLGVWSEHGIHQQKNEHEAFKYYKLAADQSYAAAQHSLGQCYYRGLGTSQDIPEAVRLFYLASEKSYALAQQTLAICYEKGTGVEKNMKKAAKLFRLASDQGCVMATYHLGKCYEFGTGVTPDMKQAMVLYQRASDMNYSEAHRKLGKCHEKGLGLAQDESKAFFYYKQASLLGNSRAQCDLGYCYQHGIGVPRDEKEAYKMYRMAAEQGYEQAKGFLLRHSYQSKEKAEELYNIVRKTQYRQKTASPHSGSNITGPLVAKHTYKADNSSERHLHDDMEDLLTGNTASTSGVQATDDMPIGNSSILFPTSRDISEMHLKNELLQNSASINSAKSSKSFNATISSEPSDDTPHMAEKEDKHMRRQILKHHDDQQKNCTLPRSKDKVSNKPTDFNDLEEWL